VNLPNGFFEQFVDELAARVAARVTELGGESTAQARESWRLWNLEETSSALGRSERWVRERAKSGELAFVKLDGGALAFLPADVEAFAEARRVAPVLARRLQTVADPSDLPGRRHADRVSNRRVQS
jgi:hypothetical protein